MKGEFIEDQDRHHHQHHHNPHSYNAHSQSHHPMFPKFPPPHLHFPPHPHSFPFAAKDSDATTTAAAATTPTSPPSKKPKTTAAAEDGGTVEVPRRPRGRPPGSKNKPKPPVVITHELEPAMSPYILELPGGCDIVDSLTRFTRRRGIGICVLTASGAVADVTLKQPSTAGAPGATVSFRGRFDILSLSALCLVQTTPFNGDFAFTISLAGPQGQIVGGMVVGPLISACTVYIVATSFNSPSFHRLPLDDHDEGHVGDDGQSSSPLSGGGSGGGGSGSGGGQMGLYSCHMGSSSSDVMWAPTVRPPPPPY